jgi:galactitol PTS system EIIA component
VFEVVTYVSGLQIIKSSSVLVMILTAPFLRSCHKVREITTIQLIGGLWDMVPVPLSQTNEYPPLSQRIHIQTYVEGGEKNLPTNWTILEEDLVAIDMAAKSKTEAIYELSKLLEEKGYVKESFPQAVVEREGHFPTGLPTSLYGVAIPHTDSHHVLHTGIAVGVLKNPVEFTIMGTTDHTVQVELVLLLAIQNPASHIQVLQQLMELFQSPEILQRLKDTGSKKEVVNVLTTHLTKELS